MASADSRSGVISFDPVAGKSIALADQVARDKTEALASLLAQKAEMLRASTEEHEAEGCLVYVSLREIGSYFKRGSVLNGKAGADEETGTRGEGELSR